MTIPSQYFIFWIIYLLCLFGYFLIRHWALRHLFAYAKGMEYKNRSKEQSRIRKYTCLPSLPDCSALRIDTISKKYKECKHKY